MEDHAARFDHLAGQTIETLRSLQDAAQQIREAALARGDDALAAREKAHILAIEERIAALGDRVAEVQGHREQRTQVGKD